MNKLRMFNAKEEKEEEGLISEDKNKAINVKRKMKSNSEN